MQRVGTLQQCALWSGGSPQGQAGDAIERQVRNDYWTYLDDIVTPDSNGDTHTANKRLWSFMKHTRQDMTWIPNLIDDNGMEYTTSLTKAHTINQQFSSVLSKVTPTTLKDTASRLLPPPDNRMEITWTRQYQSSCSQGAVLLHCVHATGNIREILH